MLERIREVAYDSALKKFVLRKEGSGKRIEVPVGGEPVGLTTHNRMYRRAVNVALLNGPVDLRNIPVVSYYGDGNIFDLDDQGQLLFNETGAYFIYYEVRHTIVGHAPTTINLEVSDAWSPISYYDTRDEVERLSVSGVFFSDVEVNEGPISVGFNQSILEDPATRTIDIGVVKLL